MFGNSNNQQNVSNSTVTPQDTTSQSSSFGPDPNSASQQADSTTSSPASVFPPTTDSADPFGTSQSSSATEPDTATPSAATATTPVPADDSLLDIKQQALNHLSPLVEHLEQAPDEKFKTTMMMIQASDDKSLIPAAFSAAKAITDDKARAQALLDIINEINYFTQQQ